jgi:undecaprenyl-diphosphatase
MNEIIIAVVLGIVEGITEFLPISSTGHLILASHVLQFTDDRANTFNIFIQLGAILAVFGYYRRRIWNLIRLAFQARPASAEAGELSQPQAIRFIAAVLLAFLPAAMIGYWAHDAIEAMLFAPKVVALALIAGGVAIILIEKFRPQQVTATMEQVSWRQAVAVGLAQCLALIPGVSRSGSTIMGGVVARLDHAAAAEFSFFLAIPTMVSATLYSLLKKWSMLSREDLLVFAVGLVVSMIVAWLVIAAFMAFIKRHSFEAFGWYRIVFGLALLAVLQMGWM